MVVSTEMNVVVLRSYDGDARGEVAPEKPYPERALGVGQVRREMHTQ